MARRGQEESESEGQIGSWARARGSTGQHAVLLLNGKHKPQEHFSGKMGSRKDPRDKGE